MSGALGLLGSVVGVGQQALTAAGGTGALLGQDFAFLSNTRSFGTLIPDCVITETHADRMQITQHPVADNTPISDHAFRMPRSVVLRAAWTNANPVGGAVQGFMSAGSLIGGLSGLLSSVLEQRAREVYAQLISMMEAAQPITVTTGKRVYENMLVSDVNVTTDRTTEFTLIAEVHFQEVIIAHTLTAPAPAQSVQANPEATASSSDTSPKQVQPAPPSWFSSDGVVGHLIKEYGSSLFSSSGGSTP
jgi:hypothetical protein